MVDVTNIEGVKEGDIVTLAGRDCDEYISIEEVAGMAYYPVTYHVKACFLHFYYCCAVCGMF